MKRGTARRKSPLMAIVLNKACNAAGARFRSRPQGPSEQPHLSVGFLYNVQTLLQEPALICGCSAGQRHRILVQRLPNSCPEIPALRSMVTALRPKVVYADAAQSLCEPLISRTCPRTVNSLIRLRGHRPHIQPSAATLTEAGFDYSGQVRAGCRFSSPSRPVPQYRPGSLRSQKPLRLP